MKKLMYIFLVLSVLTGCKEKKDAGAMPEGTEHYRLSLTHRVDG